MSILDEFGVLDPTATDPVTIAIGANPGGGTLSGTTTVSAVGGVATFGNLSIDKTGSGYTLSASATGPTGATSSAFDITAGPAAQLAFRTEPTSHLKRAPIAPAVEVDDINPATGTATSLGSVSHTR